jgi:YVTN family beta-propeller protein
MRKSTQMIIWGRLVTRFLVVFIVLASLLAIPKANARALPMVIATIPVSGAHSSVLGINSNTGRVYVGDFDHGIVSVIDMTTDTVVATIPGLKVNANDGPVDIGVNPNTNRIYVGRTVHFGGQITVIDGATNTASTIGGLGSHPVSLGVNVITNRVYVANQLSNNVSVIDGATNSVIATIGGFAAPVGVAVNPVTNLIYIGNTGTDSIAVVNGATNTIITTIAASSDPFRIAVDPTTNRIYISHWLIDSVSVVDGSSNSILATISVGDSPLGIDVNPNEGRVYTANIGSDNVSIIDGSTNTLVSTVSVGDNPVGAGVNPTTSRIYVTNSASNTVSVIEDIVDNTAPGINVSFSPPDGQNGWFVTSPVVGAVTADDTTTGASNITAINCTGATIGSITGIGTSSASAPLTISAEGLNNVSCTATDSAGNSGSSNTSTIMIDSVGPSIAITSPTNGGTYLLNSAVASSYSCQDTTSGLDTCNGPVANGANFNTSSVGVHTFTVTATDVAGNSVQASNSYNVTYNFAGFFQPVDNLPTLNIVNAGRAIPVKFSLGGDQGLDIFALGYPASTPVTCGTTAGDAIEQTVTAGSSSLTYDAATDQYTYVWKTEKAWAGTCRTLVVKLDDGTYHQANFQFK